MVSSTDISRDSKGLNGWWKLILGLLIGALGPSLVAWGSMNAKIDNNALMIQTKVEIGVFEEYKEGNTRLLEAMNATLKRIEGKIDVH